MNPRPSNCQVELERERELTVRLEDKLSQALIVNDELGMQLHAVESANRTLLMELEALKARLMNYIEKGGSIEKDPEVRMRRMRNVINRLTSGSVGQAFRDWYANHLEGSAADKVRQAQELNKSAMKMLEEAKRDRVLRSELDAVQGICDEQKKEIEILRARCGETAQETDSQAAAIALQLTTIKGAGLRLLKEIMAELNTEAGAMKRDLVRRWFRKMRDEELDLLVISVTNPNPNPNPNWRS